MKFGNRGDESVLSRFSSRTRNLLEALLNSNVAEQAMAEVEAEAIAERKALIKERAELPDRCSDKINVAIREAQTAADEVRKAEAALRAAIAEHTARVAAVGAAEGFMNSEVRRIDSALLKSADPRLQDFIFQLGQLRDTWLPALLRYDYRPSTTRRGVTDVSSNVEEISAAREALLAAHTKTEALQYQAINQVEVGQQLLAICEQLAPTLAAVNLNPPSLTAQFCEVGAPVAFGGKSVWVTDAPEVESKERREHLSRLISAQAKR